MTAHISLFKTLAITYGWMRTRFLKALFLVAMVFVSSMGHATSSPSVALHYGANPPLGDLQAFDVVVIEPDHNALPRKADYPNTQFYAYASVTEVQSTRPYYPSIPANWKLGRNGQWDSEVIDQSVSEWPEFFATQVIAPLWAKGYRGFFLDTLDSYRLASQFDEAAQQAGMVRVINTLHQQFPGIQLIFNRGFDILPQLKGKVQMVAAESLYQRWNASTKTYEPVPAADRDWLLNQLRTVQQRDGIPAIAIDYAPPHDRKQTREIAKRIQADGLIPWVTDGDISTIGIGSVEVMPRHILVVYNGDESPSINYSKAHRFLQTPLNHMGYVVDYADTRDPLPNGIWQDRYAGVVTWLTGYVDTNVGSQLSQWLMDKVNEKMPLVIMDEFGFPIQESWANLLGLKANLPPPKGMLTPQNKHAMIGFEQAPQLVSGTFPLLRLLPRATNSTSTAQPLVDFKDENQNPYTGGAIMPWGGFLLEPLTVIAIPGSEQSRWVTDPFAFLKQALRLHALPIPDVTTENGKRLLLAHIDGDGFPSRAEFSGSPFAAEILLNRILKKYPIPHTVSIIEGEIAPHGLWPDISDDLENIAKRIFALPHVELASHSYGHPYWWDRSVKHGLFADGEDPVPYNLPIKGYVLDLHREIVGSTNYINSRLAPAGKRSEVMLWTGDTAPSQEALKIAHEAGLLNMNGADTFITKAYPSLAAVAPLGIEKGGYLHVYAPVTNENIYTNLWTGPFYGFQKVLETFEMTEKPQRLKPVGIYYHTYSTSKRASLIALDNVYQWAMAQPLHPIYASEYIRKVQDFYSYSIAKKGGMWQVRGRGYLRTLRWPSTWGQPDLSSSTGIAGWSAGNETPYVHLTGDQATFAPLVAGSSASTTPKPYLYAANARISQWKTDTTISNSIEFRLEGHVTPLRFDIAQGKGCSVLADNRTIKPSSTSPNPLQTQQNLLHFTLSHASAQIQVQCPAR